MAYFFNNTPDTRLWQPDPVRPVDVAWRLEISAPACAPGESPSYGREPIVCLFKISSPEEERNDIIAIMWLIIK